MRFQPGRRAQLDRCLLTDAELEAGPAVWMSWDDPFPAWQFASECELER